MTATAAPVRAMPRQTPQVAPRNMARLLWVELRRNATPAVLPLIAVLFWFDSYRIAATMPPLWVERLFYILGQGHALIDFAPFVAGVAAWMGSRDGRRGMTDLVAATVRPRWEGQLATLAATVLWAVGFYLILMGVTLGLLGRSISYGAPPWWPIAADAVGVAAFTCAGFALGAYFPGRFIAPVAAFGAVFAMGTSSQIGFSSSGGWALILPTMSNSTFDKDAGVFYQFLPDVPIARVMFCAGVAVTAVGLLGLPVRAGGPRLRLSAAVFTGIGAAAAVTAVALASTAQIGPYGAVIPALHDAANDRPIPYTPVCRDAGIPVCVHPAYGSYLPDVTTALRPVVAEIAGLPGAPVRAAQVATVFEKTSPTPGGGPPTAAELQLATIAGSPPVLRMPLNAITLPGSFGALTASFLGQIRVQFVHGFVGAGGGAGSQVQQAIQAALLQGAGVPFAEQPAALAYAGLPSSAAPPSGPGRHHGPGTASGPIYAAAGRFAARPAAARHAWLAAHLGVVRAGRLTLRQLP
jgi:hypothetical protein